MTARRRPVHLGALFLCVVWVPLAGQEESEGDRTGALPGRVVGRVADADADGPVAGARLRLIEHGLETITGQRGDFVFEFVPPGSHKLTVSHLAFGEETITVDVASRNTTHLDIALTVRAIAVDPLVVHVERAVRPVYLETEGFYQRLERGWGEFFDPVFFERNSQGRTRFRLRVFLRTFGPALTLAPSCTGIPIYLDGVRVLEPGFLELRSWSEIGAVEVYGSATGAPHFVQDPTCGAVVVWSKRW
ncbi:MAG: carboxypeptidase-like regulatory domain-containing protein [Gemmatimonadota bacterium]|nr:carboxypeptidase-like regulatory domain-containing protein [Gemmatimonadota bacterium]